MLKRTIFLLAAIGLLAAWTHGVGTGGGPILPKLDFSKASNSMYVGAIH